MNCDKDKETWFNVNITTVKKLVSMLNGDHSHAEVKNGGAISLLPHTSS
jgi:hypothetical protein